VTEISPIRSAERLYVAGGVKLTLVENSSLVVTSMNFEIQSEDELTIDWNRLQESLEEFGELSEEYAIALLTYQATREGFNQAV
jgi:hypothetical protein